MTLLRRALLVAILAATMLLPTVPAHAAFESTATAAAAPTPGGSCFWHPIQYSVDVPAGTRYWHLEIRVYSTGGIEHSTMTPNRFAGAPTTGTLHVDICPTDDPEETWRLEPVVTAVDGRAGRGSTRRRFPAPPRGSRSAPSSPLACAGVHDRGRASACGSSRSTDSRLARATLVTRYDGERHAHRGCPHLVRAPAGDNGRANAFTRRRAHRPPRRRDAVQAAASRPPGACASPSRGWIQYDDDNRLDLPQATSPWVRVR